MTNVTKAQVNSVARQLTNKAMSWGQVAKQLSGMTGKIELSKTEKITIKEAFCLLGVHTKGNKYTAQDLNMAWSERLKEGECQHGKDILNITDNSWRCPLISKAVALTANVGGKSYKLYYKDGNEYKTHKVQELCRVVKYEDKEKGSNDVVVSAQIVLKGLVQSIYVDNTIEEYKASKAEAAKVCEAYINAGTVTAPNFVKVAKASNGVWSVVASAEVVVEVASTLKKTNKRNKKIA